MKIKTLVCISFVSLLFFSCKNKRKNSPEISFINDTISFGIIKKNIDTTIEFIYTNKGDSVLLINSIETGCSCTKLSSSKMKTYKNDSGKILINFEPSKVNDTGYVIRPIVIRTNSKPMFHVIYIQGNIIN
jgi:hypothetical protein